MHATTRLGVPLFVLLFGAASYAALPPKYAAERRLNALQNAKKAHDQADTRVKIEVLDSDVDSKGSCPITQSVKLVAKVTEVERAPKGLRAGAKITIGYTRKVTDCPGPQRYFNEVLKVGDTRPAALTCDSASCRPASAYAAFWTPAQIDEAMGKARATAGVPEVRPASRPSK